MTSVTKIYCSISTCRQPAVVTRWYVGIGSCPPLMAHLCLQCKDISLWDEKIDVIKEEKLEMNEKLLEKIS